MEILKTENLKKYYGKDTGRVKALDGVNLSVEEGEFAAVVGPSSHAGRSGLSYRRESICGWKGHFFSE